MAHDYEGLFIGLYLTVINGATAKDKATKTEDSLSFQIA